MRTPKVLTSILDNMPDIGKWQRRFIIVLLTTVFALRGRLTFTNMARFSPLSEQTFRRHFEKFFDWIAFNLTVLSLAPATEPRLFIGALEAAPS